MPFGMPKLEDRDNQPELLWALRAVDAADGDEEGGADRDDTPAAAMWDVFERWERGHRSRRGQWTKLNAMVHGDQWVDYDPNGRVRRSYATDEVIESRVSYNRMIIASEQFRSLATQERPKLGFTVATPDGNDAAAAKACKMAGHWMWRDFDLECVYADTAQGGFNLGGHFIHSWWDKRAGKPVKREIPTGEYTEDEFKTDPITQEEILVKPATEIMEEEEGFQGELRFDQHTPDQVVYSPEATVLRTAYGVFIIQHLPRWEVQRRWPDQYENVKFGAPGEYSSGLSGRYAGVPGSSLTIDDETEVALVITSYAAACPEFPRGKMVIFTRELIVEHSDNPFCPTEDEPDVVWASSQTQWCPVFRHVHYRDVRHPYGRAAAEDMVDPQESLNGKKSKSLLIIKKISHASLLAPRGTPHVDSDDPTAIMEYDRRDGPDAIRWLQPPAFPSELAGDAEDDKRQMDDISGVNAAIQGKSNADESGKKVEALQSRALGRYSEIKARLDRMYGRIVQFGIRQMVRHLEEDLIVSIIGENNRSEVQTLKVANLSSTVDVYPINDPLSTDPFQRSMQIEAVTRTVGMVKGDTVLQNRILAAQGLEELLYIQDSMTVHRDKALMENINLQNGVPPHPHHYDDDDVHIAEMITWAMSESGIRLMTPVETDDEDTIARKTELAAAFAEHLKFHEDQKMRKMGIDPETGQPIGAPPAPPAAAGGPPGMGGGPPSAGMGGGPPAPATAPPQGLATPQPSIAGV